MKNEQGKERVIRDCFAEEQVPEQIHRAIAETCAALPERKKRRFFRGGEIVGGPSAPLVDWDIAGEPPVQKKRHTAWKAAASTFGTVATAFFLLCGTNAVNPAFAESIPLIGQAFRQYNSQKKVSVGTYIGTYGGVSEVNSQAQGGEELQLTLTTREAYSDGKYIHLSFTMAAPQEYLEKYEYLSIPLVSTVNGEKLEKTEYLNLWPEVGWFAGTAAFRLNSSAKNGEALSLHYDSGPCLGITNEGGCQEDLPGTFSGSVSLTADTSHNQIVEDFDGSGDIHIKTVEATPSYTMITYETPFWGIGSGETGFPRLYTASGEPIRRSSSEEHPQEGQVDTITTTGYFDGLPNGTEQVILRFLETYAEGDMMIPSAGGGLRKVGVLGEVTIDLSTGKAVPSETYLEDGLRYASQYLEDFDDLNWSVVFDDLFLRNNVHNMNREGVFEEEDLFQNGFTLEQLDYDKTGKNRLTANFYSTNQYEKDLEVTVTAEDGRIIAKGGTKRENVFENDAMTFHDTEEEMLESMEEYLDEVRNSEYVPPRDTEELAEREREAWLRTYPGQYSYKVVMIPAPGMKPKLLDHVNVRITDPDTGGVLYERTLRFERKNMNIH